MNWTKIRLERRDHVTWTWRLFCFFVAILGTLLVTGLLISSAGKEPIEAFKELFIGAFFGIESIVETLVRATPLILTGLAAVVAFRAKIWSIGQEGQLVLGAIAAYWASILFEGLPRIIVLSGVICLGFVGGALLGVFCGWLKAKFRVDEIISTVMFNYAIFYLLTYLLSGPWQPPGDFYVQSAPVIEKALLPNLLQDTRLHGGLFIAIVVAIIVYILIKRTALGYEIRAFGSNPIASSFKGIKPTRMLIVVMLISGGIAGLAGASELLGVHGRLNTDIVAGAGYTGIIVALIGGLTPLGTVIAAVLFGAMVNGGFMMQVITGVPKSMVFAMQAITLLFFLCSTLMSQYRIRRVTADV
tara:strand:- start:411 stop:1484 length:1074 start_codon:yes stop_codon:yes gene_type:complete